MNARQQIALLYICSAGAVGPYRRKTLPGGSGGGGRTHCRYGACLSAGRSRTSALSIRNGHRPRVNGLWSVAARTWPHVFRYFHLCAFFVCGVDSVDALMFNNNPQNASVIQLARSHHVNCKRIGYKKAHHIELCQVYVCVRIWTESVVNRTPNLWNDKQIFAEDDYDLQYTVMCDFILFFIISCQSFESFSCQTIY